MIAARLVRLIQAHSEELAKRLVEKGLSSERMSDMRKVPREELQLRAYEIYHNLSDWLLTKTESDIEKRYTAIGARRARQGVALSHLLYAIMLVKENLFEFLERQGLVEFPIELYQQLELFQLVDKFFNRAIYYAARGYESARAARAA